MIARMRAADEGNEADVEYIGKRAEGFMHSEDYALVREAVRRQTEVSLRGAGAAMEPSRVLGRLEGREEVFRIVEALAARARSLRERRKVQAEADEEYLPPRQRSRGGVV